MLNSACVPCPMYRDSSPASRPHTKAPGHHERLAYTTRPMAMQPIIGTGEDAARVSSAGPSQLSKVRSFRK
eukprot:42564-Eustigmatos_ZCMA.PRE.1